MSSTTPAATPATGPLATNERILALDVIRGVALLGILLVNILGFAHPYGVNEFTASVGASGLNFWSWAITDTVFEGSQRALFALLFGAGVILLTTRMEERGDGANAAKIFYRRNIWLIIFGLVHAYILLRGDGDILFRYGVVALFLYPLRKIEPKYLIAIGVAALLIIAAQHSRDAVGRINEHGNYIEAQQVLLAGDQLTGDQQEIIDSWDGWMAKGEPTEAGIQKKVNHHTGTYRETFIIRAALAAKSQTRGLYRRAFWDSFGVMLFGMALMKLGFLTLRRPTRDYWLMVIGGYGIGMSVSLWEVNTLNSADFSMLARTVILPTYDLGRVANAVGHLGLLLLFCRSGWLTGLQKKFAAVGRMALTNYVMQSIICILIFWGVGFGLYGTLERYELYYVVVAIWIFQLIGSSIWLKHFKFGPLEWLWRSLTYKKKQPMRHMRSAPVVETG